MRPGSRWFAASTALAILTALLDASIAFAIRGALAPEAPLWSALGALAGLLVARGLVHLGFVGASQLGREALSVDLRARTIDVMLSSAGAPLAETATHLVDHHPRAVAYAQLRSAIVAYAAQAIVLAAAAVALAPRVAPVALAALALLGFVLQRIARALRAASESATTAPRVRARRRPARPDAPADHRAAPRGSRARAPRRERPRARRPRAPRRRPRQHRVRAPHAPRRSDARRDAPRRARAGARAPLDGRLGPARHVVGLGGSGRRPPRGLGGAGSRPPASARAAGGDRSARARPERIPSRGPRGGAADDGLEAPLRFEAQPGQHVALVGPSGSGKSSVLAVLLGVRAAESGVVSVGGRSPARHAAASRGRIGYVGPEPYLFAGTIRENLAYGSAAAIEESALRAALDRAAARTLVDGLDGGLDHVLGEDGAPLSSGERQRLALARALAVSPTLLVLDEPTAHVDPDAERAILGAVAALRGTVTCVMALHREELATGCDLVVRTR